MSDPVKRKRGCLFYGCLGTTILILVVLLAGYLGFRYAVERFTDSKPMVLPKAQLSSEETRRLRERISQFSQAVSEGKSAGLLTITTDEANALIQSDHDWAFLKDQVYVTFESNQLKAQLSVPAEKLGSRRLRGRYLNASGTFTIVLRDGQLQVNAESLEVKGRPISESFMRQVRPQNLALGFTNAAVNAAMQKLESLQIKDGQLIIVPRGIH